jgi:hypothetical protein
LIRQQALDYAQDSGRLHLVEAEADVANEGVAELTPSRAAGESNQEVHEPIDIDAARARLESIRTDIKRRKRV